MNQGSEKYFGKSWSYFTARETSVFGLDRKALSFKNLENYYNYSQEDATLDFLTSRRQDSVLCNEKRSHLNYQVCE